LHQPGRVPEFCGPLPEGPGPTSSSGSLPALRVARRCSPVGFGRQHQLMDIAYASYLLANHGAGTGRGARLELLTPEASTSGSGGDAYVDRPALPLVMHGVHASGAAPMHSVAHPALDIAPIHAASLLLQRGVRTLPIGRPTRPRPLVDRLLLWMSRRPSLR
jgi:hypothetical protein